MAGIKVNFAEVEDFNPLPEGRYPVRIEEVLCKENNAKDGRYLNYKMVVTDGEFAGRKLFAITSLKPRGLFKTKEAFEALGVDGDEMEIDYDEDSLVVTSPELVDLECIVGVTQSVYDGKVRNQVDNWYELDERSDYGSLPEEPEKKKPATKKKFK